MIRNCIEADILKKLGGTDLQCQGTQIEILRDIVSIKGGIPVSRSRNVLLQQILTLS